MESSGANLCWALGNNLQFYPNFALFSTLGEWTSTKTFFQLSKLSEDQKKSSPGIEHFFPRIQVKTKKQTNKQKRKGLHHKYHTFFPEFTYWLALPKNKPKKQTNKKQPLPKNKKQKKTTNKKQALPKNKQTNKKEKVFSIRCTPESHYWRGCRWRPYSNCGGYTVKLLGGYIPPIPPGFGTCVGVCNKTKYK